VRLVDPHTHEKALACTAVLDPERRLRHRGERVGVLLSPRVEATSRARGFEGRDEQRPLPDVYKLSGHGGSLDGWSVIDMPAGTGQTKQGRAIARRQG
jgi:hypothetical protein